MINRSKHIQFLLTLLVVFSISFPVLSQSTKAPFPVKIKITIAQHEIIINLFDNPMSRQLLVQLPLTLNFKDYAGAEKIAYLPNKLHTKEIPNSAEVGGDFSYYAPWGNLAIFYKGIGQDSHLYPLGHIESGKNVLSTLGEHFTATISRME